MNEIGQKMLERQDIYSQEILLRALDEGFFNKNISRLAELDFYKKHNFYPSIGVDKEWPEFFDARKKKLGVEIVNTKTQGLIITHAQTTPPLGARAQGVLFVRVL